MTKTPDDRLAQDFGTKVRTMIHRARRAGEVKVVSVSAQVCKHSWHFWRLPREGEPQEVIAVCDWCGAYGESVG